MADETKQHPETPDPPKWDSGNPAQSLDALRGFVESEAQKSIDWYWAKKNGKKLPSQIVQFGALTLTALAGLVPIILQVLKSAQLAKLDGFDSGPVASLCVGLAAGLLGLDKAWGLSSGWTRYVLTATSMSKVLQEFRVDWVLLYAGLGSPLKPEDEAKLIQRARQLVTDIQTALLDETKQWASEFQSNTGQMEKDVRSQLDTLKTKLDQVEKDREAAEKPGGIELTIPNADKADGYQVAVMLQSAKNTLTESLANSKVWTQIGTSPGQYKVAVAGRSGGNAFATSTIIEVKPGEVAKPTVTIPV